MSLKPYMTDEEIEEHVEHEYAMSRSMGYTMTKEECREKVRHAVEYKTKKYERAKEILANKEYFDITPYIEQIENENYPTLNYYKTDSERMFRQITDKLQPIYRTIPKDDEHHDTLLEMDSICLAIGWAREYLSETYHSKVYPGEPYVHGIHFTDTIVPKEMWQGVQDLAKEEGE